MSTIACTADFIVIEVALQKQQSVMGAWSIVSGEILKDQL